jgi:hypothetical protein
MFVAAIGVFQMGVPLQHCQQVSPNCILIILMNVPMDVILMSHDDTPTPVSVSQLSLALIPSSSLSQLTHFSTTLLSAHDFVNLI